MHNISEMVTRVASLGLNENQSSAVFLAKIWPKTPKKFKLNPLKYKRKKSEKIQNQIQYLSQDPAAVTLSTIHLLENLLNKNVGFYKIDIANMQSHYLHLKGIIDSVKNKGSTSFVLTGTILYKKQGDHLLLAIPKA